ncbi:type II secretion system F family protein [candidate division KSB3 bacterium]|uniref:Type II secretion system F family protein n=1 Tax=candidate division KSB3 bacterium TaxID=2044937 RepID=A0A9D5Q554_9BACT|nr:type II secretion system F family protein [candidate division KSB3 bacterium]MBD3323968.1 type II secretion system F family protein [candidate division KSB3 bacterium]
MPEFTYKVKIAGRTLKKSIEAPTKEAAIKVIKGKTGADLKSVKPKPKEISIPFLDKILAPKVTTKDITIFTRMFATMIDSGLPLVQGLEILSNDNENATMGALLKKIRTDVEEGSTFADALRKHPRYFDNLFVNLVEAGEAGGILDTILNRLATYMEKNEAVKAKIKSAMVYPIIVVSVAVVVVAVLMIFVIPVFANLFSELGAELPLPTKIVIAISNFMQRWVVAIIIALVALFFAFKKFYATERGRIMVDSLTLKLPLFSDLIVKSSVARFTRTLGTLISSGVPILDSLEITARASGHAIIEMAILATRDSIKEGKTIAEPLEATEVFPGMVVQMIGVGEQSGALDAMLTKIADFYEEEVDTAVEALTSAMEPLMIVFLGITVGGVVIAMYMPLFTMISALK